MKAILPAPRGRETSLSSEIGNSGWRRLCKLLRLFTKQYPRRFLCLVNSSQIYCFLPKSCMLCSLLRSCIYETSIHMKVNLIFSCLPPIFPLRRYIYFISLASQTMSYHFFSQAQNMSKFLCYIIFFCPAFLTSTGEPFLWKNEQVD